MVKSRITVINTRSDLWCVCRRFAKRCMINKKHPAVSGCFCYVCLLHTVIVKIYLVISLYRSFDGSYFFVYFYNLAVLIKIQCSAAKTVFMLHTAYHRYIVLIKHAVTADIIFYRCFLAALIYCENACRFFFVRAIGVLI